ncbi:MAG: tRNA (adenosine(37)-N6)-threonylcarbamoyltransferase complex transferase subunit TsaD, partial [Bacteroidetes bacterium]
MSNPVVILGIESSCDDTGASVLKGGKIQANIIANQTVHKEYGGVVPELASRAHQQNIVPVVHEALKSANVDKSELSAIAFTKGPGLLGSLLVGTSFAKSMALGLNIPLIEINHMKAHVLSHFIELVGEESSKPSFPFLCLTVSGGHTEIVLVEDYLKMKVIGSTRDDAAGEAFDKAAKTIGLEYPGGPLIDKHAKNGNPLAYKFPHPKSPEYDYSFSGLKTAFLYFIRDHVGQDSNFVSNNMADICASIQHTIVEVLLKKLVQASKDLGISEIAISGGVAANSKL